MYVEVTDVDVVVIVIVIVVVFVVGCRKLTICSVMELRRFRILQNLCVTDILAFHGCSNFISPAFCAVFVFISFFPLCSIIFLHFCLKKKNFGKFSFHFLMHAPIPTKWLELEKIFKSSFDNFSFQSQLMGQHISSFVFFLSLSMGQFFLSLELLKLVRSALYRDIFIEKRLFLFR